MRALCGELPTDQDVKERWIGGRRRGDMEQTGRIKERDRTEAWDRKIRKKGAFDRQEEAGDKQETGRRPAGGMGQERLGRKVHLTGRNRQMEAGDKQVTGRTQAECSGGS
jgi:hypothetical protein